MIHLPKITLVAMSSVQKAEHQYALDCSCREIEFGAVKLLDLNTHNIDDWCKAVIYELPKYITTEFCLLIHADGYVIQPKLWNNEWLNYDYIGAPWPLPPVTNNLVYTMKDIHGVCQRVGNGGFSLRSKRLLDFGTTLDWESFEQNTIPNYRNEDLFVCVHHRHKYEEAGMKFASLDVAKHFSKECEIPENTTNIASIYPTFGFHQHGDFHQH